MTFKRKIGGISPENHEAKKITILIKEIRKI
jgi:hypothetical protein